MKENDYIMKNIKAKPETIHIDGKLYFELDSTLAWISEYEEAKKVYSVSDIAVTYGMSAVELNQYLQAKKIQYKRCGVWHIYSKYAKKGYVSTISGKNKKTHLYWTTFGKAFIEQLLADDGYTKIQ